MRFPLRAKFFLFATLIATAPLALVGENLVRIARDELKSAANEDLTHVAAQLRSDFDATASGRWRTPLMVIRNGIDSDELGVQQKVSLLTLGLSQIPDIVALQLTVEGSDLPILVTDQVVLRPPGRGRARPGRDAAHPGGRRSRTSGATGATARCGSPGSTPPATGSRRWRCRCAPASATAP